MRDELQPTPPWMRTCLEMTEAAADLIDRIGESIDLHKGEDLDDLPMLQSKASIAMSNLMEYFESRYDRTEK